MKNVMIAFSMVVLLLFTFGTIAVNETDSGKEQTLTESLRLALYQTVEECKDESKWRKICEKYGSESSVEDEIMVLRFKENFLAIMHTTDPLYLKVVECDWMKGIFSVEVRQEYINFGIKREITAMETVIYNEKIDANET